MSDKKITATKDFVTDGIASTLTGAKTYSDNQDKITLANAKTYADEVGKTIQSSAKLYADEVGKTATTNAKSYTDTEIGKIKVPTKVSELENDGIYFTADKVYGTEVYDVERKEKTSIILTTPTKDESDTPPHTISTFTAQVPLKDYMEERISESVANRLRYRGVVATFNDLPTDATAGDICKVTETGSKYIYIDSKWQKIEEVDLSAYVKSGEVMNYVPKATPGNFGVVTTYLTGTPPYDRTIEMCIHDGIIQGLTPIASLEHFGGVKLSHKSLPDGKTKYGTYMHGHTLYAFGESGGGFDPKTKEIAIGLDANVYIDTPGIAIGYGATVSNHHGIAIGRNAYAYYAFGISIGYKAEGRTNGVAIGVNTVTCGTKGVAIGYGSTSKADGAIAIGASALAGENGIALGSGAYAHISSVAIGHGAYAPDNTVAFAVHESKFLVNSSGSGAHASTLVDVIKKYGGGNVTAYGWHMDTTTIDLTNHEVYWADYSFNSVTIKLPDFTNVSSSWYPKTATVPSRRILTIRFNNSNSKIAGFDNPSHSFYPRYEEDGTEEKDITNETFKSMDKVVIEMIPLGVNSSDQEWFIRWTKVTA